MSSVLGNQFKVSSFGESHGVGVGVVVDGCPSRVPIDEALIQAQLDRRKPGQSEITTPRAERDEVEILSGVQRGVTLGTPIGLLIRNHDTRPGDYAEMLDAPRPSHADYTYWKKYGIRAKSGGGRASARETAGRVAAGAVAEAYLTHTFGIEVVAWVSAVGDRILDAVDEGLTRADVDATMVRCPDAALAAEMQEQILAIKEEGDSVGGVVSCLCRGVPAGWGEPVFDKVEALMAQAMLSIPATKGFEIGSGFGAARMRGSVHNDRFLSGQEGELRTVSNYSGGVQGGITNGEPLLMRVAFKPPATIKCPQQTVDYEGREVTLQVTQGRHDPCVVPRAVPVVESMAALVLADLARLV